MVSKWKAKRDNTIQRVAGILLDSQTTMDSVVHNKVDEKYIHALQKSNPERSAMVIGQTTVDYEDIYDYCKYLDTPPDERNIPLAKRIPLAYIEDHLKTVNKSWGSLPYSEKMDMLFDLGLAVKQSEENMDIASKYYVNMENYRGRDNKVHVGLVIVGSERIDKAWVKSGYASDDAILYTRDGGLASELARLSRR